MKKILNIFAGFVRNTVTKREVATLGAVRIIELQNGSYQVVGGTQDERMLLRQYLSINMDETCVEVESGINEKIFSLMRSL